MSTLPALTAAQRRTALKQALRNVANIADIADKVCGVRNLSQLTMAQLDAVAAAAKLDVSNLAAPAVQAAPAVHAAPDAVEPAAVEPDAVEPDAVEAALGDTVSAAAVDADIAAVLSSSFADMPAALRLLALRANQPPRVVERVVTVDKIVEKIVHADLPVAPVAAKPGKAPVVSKPVVKLLRVATAQEIFKIKHPVLARLEVAVYDDPLAPAIDPAYVFDGDVLALALLRLNNLQNLLLAGPKGTGKTSFAEQIAAYLGRFFALISFDRTSEIDPLIGQIELAGGNTFWRDGALVAAMRRPGSIILLDEPDVAKAGALAALHPVLAGRSILISRTGERVQAADGVAFFAASNTTGHGDATGTYVDRNLMDAAFRDRFADIVVIDYPSAAVERRILTTRTGISRAAADILVAYARATRGRADKEQDIAQGLGLRRLLAWATGLLGGVNPDLVFRSSIVNQHSTEEGEVLWQLYKSTVDQGALVAAVDAPDAPGSDEEQPDTDVFA
jgi:MoxR-like ATPase